MLGHVKYCTRCKRDLLLAEFNFNDRASGRRQAYCRARSRAYVRDHYARNKQYYVEKALVRGSRERAFAHNWVLEYLLSHPCADCGENDPVVLDFDHAEPGSKRLDVANMIQRRWAWARIEAEIAKCVVRCANCHRRRTARQFGWYRLKPPNL